MALAYSFNAYTKTIPAPLFGRGNPSRSLPGELGQYYFDIVSNPRNIWIYVGARWERIYPIGELGTATLVAGTVTIANDTIGSNDTVFAIRTDVNSSTAIGFLQTELVPGTEFTINSLDATGAVETDDVSIVSYYIVRG